MHAQYVTITLRRNGRIALLVAAGAVLYHQSNDRERAEVDAIVAQYVENEAPKPRRRAWKTVDRQLFDTDPRFDDRVIFTTEPQPTALPGSLYVLITLSRGSKSALLLGADGALFHFRNETERAAIDSLVARHAPAGWKAEFDLYDPDPQSKKSIIIRSGEPHPHHYTPAHAQPARA